MNLTNTQKKYLTYGTLGLGLSALVYVLIRKLSGRRGSTPLRGKPQMKLRSSAVSAEGSSRSSADDVIPALALYFDESTGEFEQYEINYTPQADPQDINQISMEDYERLQSVGLIPENFPFDQIVAIPSHNERNWFFVGYSAPFSMRTNRDPLTVIEPLWAVSYGLNFDPENSPAEDFPNEAIFYDVALRTTFAEWLLTNRGIDGCHKNLTLSECNIERAALLNLIIQRTRMKQSRIDSGLSYDSVIYGPGIRWNGSSQFMSSYEGEIPDKAVRRFNDFYETSFWPMPMFSGFAVGFIHPYSMSKGGSNPSWIKTTKPFDDDMFPYLSDHTILLGKAVFTDTRRNFK